MVDGYLKDESPHVHPGDYVQMKRDWEHDSGVIIEQGDVGTILEKGDYSDPTVHWERTDIICDTWPDLFEVLAPPGFAADEASTPKAKRTTYVRRSGV